MVGPMIRRRVFRPSGAAIAGALLWGVVAASTGLADDDRIEEDPLPGAAQRQEGNIIDLEANFDANLFEQTGGGLVIRGNGLRVRRPSPTGEAEAESESQTLARLRQLGLEKLDRVDRTCGLSDAQQAKLTLAVESDAREIAEEIEATRSRYAGTAANFAQPEGQKKWQAFQQDVQRCRARLQAAFEADSLFAAVLAETLDEQQRAGLDRESRARRSFRWRAMLAPVLLKMDETLGLTRAQHAALERALVAAEPPLRPEAPPGRRNTHAEQMLVYLQLSKADANVLRGEFSDRQWRALSMLMNQGKAMKSWLDQQGLVEFER